MNYEYRKNNDIDAINSKFKDLCIYTISFNLKNG